MKIESAWNKWCECLEDRDRNSIYNQMIVLIRDAGIFRLIMDCRKWAIEQDITRPKFNVQLHNFIDRNFIENQASAIRRLTDGYGLYGKKGVYSISGLIEQIKAYQGELNRMKYLELRKLTCTDKSMQKVSDENIKDRINRAHMLFDALSNVDVVNRTPNDLISNTFINKLEEKLERCNKLNEYVNKFIAHASSRESRDLENYKTPQITIGYLWDIHKLLCETVDFISGFISDTTLFFLPIEKPNFYEYWDHSLIDARNIERIKTTYEDYRKDISNWRFGI